MYCDSSSKMIWLTSLQNFCFWLCWPVCIGALTCSSVAIFGTTSFWFQALKGRVSFDYGRGFTHLRHGGLLKGQVQPITVFPEESCFNQMNSPAFIDGWILLKYTTKQTRVFCEPLLSRYNKMGCELAPHLSTVWIWAPPKSGCRRGHRTWEFSFCCKTEVSSLL